MAKTPPEPRLSGTILMLRDAPDLQVLMVKRHYEIDFAAGALVFPGGKAQDADARADWAERLDGAEAIGDATARIAAIREAFEEAGLLLARPRDARGVGRALVGEEVAARLGPHRLAVDRGETDFLELIRQEDLVLALDTLVHFGHWVTPEMMPKRFDTHFYLAATPEGQTAEQDGRETTEAVWIGPREALAQEAAGVATIIFPTRLNLRRLAQAANTADALARFRDQAVTRVLPQVGQDAEGRPCLVIPEVEGYGQTTEPLENVANVARPKS